ncbi:hypothetical protein ABTL37_19585, partial [Acinetobacter baumannii]
MPSPQVAADGLPPDLIERISAQSGLQNIGPYHDGSGPSAAAPCLLLMGDMTSERLHALLAEPFTGYVECRGDEAAVAG